MKNAFIILFSCLIFVSCEKKEEKSVENLLPPVAPDIEQADAPKNPPIKSIEKTDGAASVQFNGTNFHFIGKKASSWDELAFWVKNFGDEESVLWLDVHSSGEAKIIVNTKGDSVSSFFSGEFERVYSKNINVVKDDVKYGVTKRATRDKVASILLFLSDIDSEKEEKVAAKSLISAALETGKKDVVLTIGHLRSVGDSSRDTSGLKTVFKIYDNILEYLVYSKESDFDNPRGLK